MSEKNIYEENGYANRQDYLNSLCIEYDETMVLELAELLGESEDFDGLITGLQDFSQ